MDNISIDEKERWKPGNMLYPVPAVMVSCMREGGRPNIITIAWCATISSEPPMISISVRPERYSYDIIKESGEFVVNLTTKELAAAADYCGVKSGRDTDKFRDMNLTECVSQTVKCPGIAESPVNIECKTDRVIELGSHHMFIARVNCVNISKRFMDERGKFDLNGSGLVAYSHGEYHVLGEKLGKFGYSVKK